MASKRINPAESTEAARYTPMASTSTHPSIEDLVKKENKNFEKLAAAMFSSDISPLLDKSFARDFVDALTAADTTAKPYELKAASLTDLEKIKAEYAAKAAAEKFPSKGHASRSHSRHSPSSLEPILMCSGFLNDPHGDKTAADRGTRGHEAIEKGDPDSIKDDDSLRAAVERCIKYTRKLEAGADKVLVEKRVKILDQSGSFDRLIIKGKEADMLDYKFAWNAYSAEGMQARAYAVGIFDEFPSLVRITAHFIMPFLGTVSVHEYTRGDYDLLVAEVRAVIERARKADPSEFRITKYCGYCARAGTCPRLGEIAHGLAAKYEDAELKLPEEPFDVHGSAFKDPEKAAMLLKLAGPVEKAAESWRRGALRLRLEEGVDLPGFKLVTAKGKRSVTNAALAYEAVKDVVPSDEFIAISSVPIGKLEEIYGSRAPKGKKAAFIAELNDKLHDASAISEGASIHKLVAEKGT